MARVETLKLGGYTAQYTKTWDTLIQRAGVTFPSTELEQPLVNYAIGLTHGNGERILWIRSFWTPTTYKKWTFKTGTYNVEFCTDAGRTIRIVQNVYKYIDTEFRLSPVVGIVEEKQVAKE